MKETLQQLQQRAAAAGCSLEIEFLAEQGQCDGDDSKGTFEEGGSYSVKFKPYPRVDGFVGWGGALPYTPDDLALSHAALDEFEKGLPGNKASDYEVVEYDISGFENVVYPNIEDQMMEAVATEMTIRLDEQLSGAARDMLGPEVEDIELKLEDINWLQDVDHGVQGYAPQEMQFGDYEITTEFEIVDEDEKSINAFDKCKPMDLD